MEWPFSLSRITGLPLFCEIYLSECLLLKIHGNSGPYISVFAAIFIFSMFNVPRPSYFCWHLSNQGNYIYTGGNYIFMWFQYILLMYFFLGLCSLAALISNVALYKSVTLYGKEPVKNQKELSWFDWSLCLAKGSLVHMPHSLLFFSGLPGSVLRELCKASKRCFSIRCYRGMAPLRHTSKAEHRGCTTLYQLLLGSSEHMQTSCKRYLPLVILNMCNAIHLKAQNWRLLTIII